MNSPFCSKKCEIAYTLDLDEGVVYPSLRIDGRNSLL